MAEFEKPKHGEICWRELQTHNLDLAAKFYQGLFGWNLKQSKLSPVRYEEIQTGGKAVGGMIEINEEWGVERQEI